MTMATTTIRIDIATLPDHLDRSRPNVVVEVIEAALREGGIKADCSDLFSHLKIDVPTAKPVSYTHLTLPTNREV